jgi:hypothetical protein
LGGVGQGVKWIPLDKVWEEGGEKETGNHPGVYTAVLWVGRVVL